MVAFQASAALLLSLAGLVASQAKTVLFNPNTDILNEGFKNNVPSQPYEVTKRWAQGDGAPTMCIIWAVEARSETGNPAPRCEASELDVWSVRYEDCPTAWNFCRCQNSPVSEEQMMIEFGRLPVNLRSHVRTVMAFPWDKPDEGQGQARFFDLLLLAGANTVDFVTSPTVMVHEASHIVDFLEGSFLHNDFTERLSGQQAFLDALNNDTCVVDQYSFDHIDQIPPAEVWAQDFMVHRYLEEFGVLPNGLSPSCLSHQLSTIGSQTDTALSGPTCNMSIRNRIPVDPIIPKVWPPTGRATRALEKHRRSDAASGPGRQLCDGFSSGLGQ